MNTWASDPWLRLVVMLGAETAVIVGLAAGGQYLARSAGWRRTIWQTALLALAVIAIAEGFGVGPGVGAWTAALFRKPSGHESSRVMKPIQAMSFPSDSTKAPITRTIPNAIPVQAPREPRPSAVFNNRLPSHSAAAPAAVRNLEFSLAHYWVGLVWLFGFAGLLGRVCFGRLMQAAFSRRCELWIEGTLPQRVQKLARRLGLRRQIRVLRSTRLTSPIAFGVIRPTIGLTERFADDFTPSQQDAVLVHELAHLRAHDPVWHWGADVVAAALWWHPLVWWTRRQFLQASESAADEASAILVGGPHALADSLVALATRLASTQRCAGWMGIEGRDFKSGLGRRVERLLRSPVGTWRPPNRLPWRLARFSGSMGLAMITILCAAWVGPKSSLKPTTNPDGTIMKTLVHSWRNSAAAWLVATTVTVGNHGALAEATGQSSTHYATPAASTSHAAATRSAASSTGITAGVVREKLEHDVLSELFCEGLPLGEVVKQLHDESIKLDADKAGVNFLFSRVSPQHPATLIDPSTGLPVHATESIDLQAVAITVSPPMKNVRMIDALDILTKAADQPIHYTMEDYGVVIAAGPAPLVTNSEFSPLLVRAFQLDTNNLVSSVEKTFHYVIGRNTALLTADAFDPMLDKLRLNLNAPGKAIFYNGNTGVLMMRATAPELDVMEAAVVTLGGRAEKSGKTSAEAANVPRPSSGVIQPKLVY